MNVSIKEIRRSNGEDIKAIARKKFDMKSGESMSTIRKEQRHARKKQHCPKKFGIIAVRTRFNRIPFAFVGLNAFAITIGPG